MDLFEISKEEERISSEPLASRLRPVYLEDIVGQEHIIGKDKLLYRAIKADKLSSIILYGPPGTGKTTIAKVIANTTKSIFRQVNATTQGKQDLEDVVRSAKDHYIMEGKKTILFIDEIHRFNKSQQDYLLPHVENGTVILIGATTENPFFEVNSALISRSRIFELKPLNQEDIINLIDKALKSDKGYKKLKIRMDRKAKEFLADAADGDARSALNALELAVMTTEPTPKGYIVINIKVIEDCIQRKAIRYDKDGDQHYDAIKAFIESMIGSDPDAALYYLARMLEAGEDVKFIARRIMIAASEEVGNADPRALEVATSAALAVERVGMPEGRLILAQAATYVACAPKSDSVAKGIQKAYEEVKRTGNLKIPSYLQESGYKGAASLGRGIGLKWPHDYPNHWVEQQYLPDAIKDHKYYELSDIGYEKKLKQYFYYIGKYKDNSK